MIPIINIHESNAVRPHGAAWAIDFISPSGRRFTEYVGGRAGKIENGVFSVEPFVLKPTGGFSGAIRTSTVIGGTKIEAEVNSVEAVSHSESAVIKKGFFTVESATDRHRTFRVKTSARSGKTIIGLMTGSNNLKDYTWFGFVNGSKIGFWRQPNLGFGVPADMPIPQDQVLECWAAITSDVDSAGLRFAREYQNCSRCGKVLTTPESLNRGRGAECDGLMYGESRRHN